MRNENLNTFYDLVDAGFPAEHIVKELERHIEKLTDSFIQG